MKIEPMKVEYPVAKTFIQYPTLRNPSLDEFFQERVISSCPTTPIRKLSSSFPAGRMNSIEEDEDATETPNTPVGATNDHTLVAKDLDSLFGVPSFAFAASEVAHKERNNANDLEYTVKNTFIDFPAWEPLRKPSLEGFFQERALKSCPTPYARPIDDSLENPLKLLLAGNGEEHVCQVENPAVRSISLEECLRDIEDKYQNLEEYDDAVSTKANTDEDNASPTPGLLSDAEEETGPLAISLTSSLGLWSVGSANHHLGTCKPCAFLWKDAEGCQHGVNCSFCHMCPPGAVKQRKKQKMAMRKMVRQSRKAQMGQVAGYY
jgi:hypothetical protein